MADDRQARVASYQAQSEAADDLVCRGRREEALIILREQRELAAKAGDEDYVAFFEAEELGWVGTDRSAAQALLQKGMDWAAAEGVGPDSFLLTSMGVYLSLDGDVDAAISWYDKALAENPHDSKTMRLRGVSLSKKGDEDAAIEWYDKALAENPHDFRAMLQRGVSLSEKGDEDAAIEWYDKTLAENPHDFDAMRQRGVSMSEKGDEDAAIAWVDRALAENPHDFRAMLQRGALLSKKGDDGAAIEWYDKALAENPCDPSAMRGKSVSLFNSGKPRAALHWIGRAAKVAPERYRSDFYFVCSALGLKADEKWRMLFPNEPAVEVESSPKEELSELSAFIQRIRDAYADQATEFLEKKKQAEGAKHDFLEPASHLDPNASVLLFLRRWNSYTPAVPSSDENSRGGGYFLWHKGMGTVIDPGYDFLDNFCAFGGRLCDIHNIIVTHAHPDHLADFETLCTLLHEYNHEGNDAPHKVRFFLNNTAFARSSAILPLRECDYIAEIHTLNPGWRTNIAGGMSLEVLPAHHDDVLAHDQSVGVLLRLQCEEERTLLFTSDTGLFPLKPDHGPGACEPDVDGLELWEKYPDVTPDLMVIHIGSVKEKELSKEFAPKPADVCYPNHLGIIGVARMITKVRPHLAVVSEFGEELQDFRVDLVRGLQEQVVDRALEGEAQIPRVIPSDLPLIYNIERASVWDCVGRRWIPANAIRFREHEAADAPLHVLKGPLVYYCRHLDRFVAKPDLYAGEFGLKMKNKDGLYFK